jgi:hypothetical protein
VFCVLCVVRCVFNGVSPLHGDCHVFVGENRTVARDCAHARVYCRRIGKGIPVRSLAQITVG